MQFDLNEIGRVLFKYRYPDSPKHKMSLTELNDIADELKYRLNNITNNIILQSHYDKEEYILALKTILLLCYINNIDINQYIQVNEDNNTIHT